MTISSLSQPDTMIHAVLIFNNAGKPRLTKFYSVRDTLSFLSLSRTKC